MARVPDTRLDRLTALFKPKRRVPATVEFADLVGGGHASTEALLDVAPFRDADALVHVVRAFRDEEVAHHAPLIDPAADDGRKQRRLRRASSSCGIAVAA